MLSPGKMFTSLIEEPGLHQFRCNDCGGLVVDKKLHTDFHKTLETIASDVYGVPTEDM